MSFFSDVETDLSKFFTGATETVATLTVDIQRTGPVVEGILGIGQAALKSADPAAASAVQPLVTKVEAGLVAFAQDASQAAPLLSDGIALLEAALPFFKAVATVAAAAA